MEGPNEPKVTVENGETARSELPQAPFRPPRFLHSVCPARVVSCAVVQKGQGYGRTRSCFLCMAGLRRMGHRPLTEICLYRTTLGVTQLFDCIDDTVSPLAQYCSTYGKNCTDRREGVASLA